MIPDNWLLDTLAGAGAFVSAVWGGAQFLLLSVLLVAFVRERRQGATAICVTADSS